MKLGSTGILPVHSRRNLPHWEMGGSTYFITFRTRGVELPAEARLIVLDACRHFDGQKYQLWIAMVMPDHAHLLLTPKKIAPGEWYSLASIMHSLKSFTANKINLLLNRTGSLWQENYYSRIVPDEGEFLEKWNYIRNNPVKKELCESPENWDGLYEYQGEAAW